MVVTGSTVRTYVRTYIRTYVCTYVCTHYQEGQNVDCILFQSVCYSKPGCYDKLSKLGCIYVLMYIRTYMFVCACMRVL